MFVITIPEPSQERVVYALSNASTTAAWLMNHTCTSVMTIVHFPPMLSQLSRGKFPGFFFETTGIKYFARKTIDTSSISRSTNESPQLPGALPFQKILGPSTFLQLSDSTVTHEWLSEKIDRFSQVDDVFSASFLQNIVFVQHEDDSTPRFDSPVQDLIASMGASVSFLPSGLATPHEGPFYISGGAIHRVWRLYPDTSESFVTAIIRCAEDDSKYEPFNASSGRSIMIAVPSRLYDPPSADKPLNGLRLSIKDNMDLAGLHTDLSCRAWADLYPARTTTASAVSRLTSLGAVLIGKTKLSQFAEVESVTADWVDVSMPFNPRGDGYLTPDCSTSGGAAALATYPWLDVSLGTDTGGSLRMPAARQGLFAIRSTWDALPVDGIFPLSRPLDSVGMLTRDINVHLELSHHWYDAQDPTHIQKFEPKRLICFKGQVFNDQLAQNTYAGFISKLEKYLNIKKTEIDIEDTWKLTDPSCDGTPMNSYLEDVQRPIKCYDLWHDTQQFRDEYYQARGRPPYVNPAIRIKWSEGKKISKETYQSKLERTRVFKQWFTKHFLESTPDSADTLIVYPVSSTQPLYRDEYTSGPRKDGVTFVPPYYSVFAGCPELVIPIGQIPYGSRVSDQTEQLPVCASFVAAQGADVALADFTKLFLERSSLPTRVRTGHVAFE